jgi:hypothetical protein
VRRNVSKSSSIRRMEESASIGYPKKQTQTIQRNKCKQADETKCGWCGWMDGVDGMDGVVKKRGKKRRA